MKTERALRLAAIFNQISYHEHPFSPVESTTPVTLHLTQQDVTELVDLLALEIATERTSE